MWTKIIHIQILAPISILTLPSPLFDLSRNQTHQLFNPTARSKKYRVIIGTPHQRVWARWKGWGPSWTQPFEKHEIAHVFFFRPTLFNCYLKIWKPIHIWWWFQIGWLKKNCWNHYKDLWLHLIPPTKWFPNRSMIIRDRRGHWRLMVSRIVLQVRSACIYWGWTKKAACIPEPTQYCNGGKWRFIGIPY